MPFGGDGPGLARRLATVERAGGYSSSYCGGGLSESRPKGNRADSGSMREREGVLFGAFELIRRCSGQVVFAATPFPVELLGILAWSRGWRFDECGVRKLLPIAD